MVRTRRVPILGTGLFFLSRLFGIPLFEFSDIIFRKNLNGFLTELFSSVFIWTNKSET